MNQGKMYALPNKGNVFILNTLMYTIYLYESGRSVYIAGYMGVYVLFV